ncbi:MAG: hypothetical protein R2706_01110 [Acidimicrobiales bacterium]
MCPTSNLHTGAAPSMAEHPIGLLRDLNYRVTVNTDNRLMSDVNSPTSSSVSRRPLAMTPTTWNGSRSTR